MREIKFRGETLYKPHWVYGSLRLRKGVSHGIIENDEGLGYDVDLETVGQYIGQKTTDISHEKEGVTVINQEIYEGDILKLNSSQIAEVDELAVVIFQDSCFGVITSTMYGKDCFKELYTLDKYEIIGNIHDNPELIK